jgi:hypothetical protein
VPDYQKITLDFDELAAGLASFFVSIPPSPAPTLYPTTGAGVIYADGKFYWPGDWSNAAGPNVQLNYSALVNSVPVLSVTAQKPYPYWLPYAPNVGPPVAPGSTYLTPSYNTASNSNLVLMLKPTAATDQPTVAVDTYVMNNGYMTGDVSLGQANLNDYASKPDANGFVTYVVPLANLNAANKNIYKILVQDSQTPVGNSFEIKYAAFV